jgi:LAO/AO transport system kinase
MTNSKSSLKKDAVDAARKRIKSNRIESQNVPDIARAVVDGHREELAKAITLIESELASDRPIAQNLLKEIKDLTDSSVENKTVRIGITGIPGVGKSTFIERLGLDLINDGYRVAVLAVDPSSKRTGGSILGDKTRMDELAVNKKAFVRPSPASDALGGVARATMEAIILCEAAGFDRIIVETVGVGQSEISVREMVDVFTLLLIAGAGDEVQGIKRGIVEMSDLIVVHKADGNRINACRSTALSYSNALHLFPTPPGGVGVKVLTASSAENTGHNEVRAQISNLTKAWKSNGWWLKQRSLQRSDRMTSHATELLFSKQLSVPSSLKLWQELKDEVSNGLRSAFSAAWDWVNNEGNKSN